VNHSRFENLRVGDALIPPPLRVPPQWHKTPFKYRASPGVLARLRERERDQGHKCAICQTTEPGGKHQAFNMDHCHVTGFVRSMLCLMCNIAIPPWADAVVTRLASQRLKQSHLRNSRPDLVAHVEKLADYLEFWESMFASYEQAISDKPDKRGQARREPRTSEAVAPLLSAEEAGRLTHQKETK
jgi:Recombination endonuclease VII